jgi:predicted anti-sigma-YlaC factor YlaD
VRRLTALVVAAVLLGGGLAGCASPRDWALGQLADGLAQTAAGAEEDLDLARDAAPVVLKASELLLAQRPGHRGLAESVAAGFTQYAYAFVAFEADRRQAADARAAQQLNERAARLYARAHRHAMQALLATQPRLHEQLSRPEPPADALRPAELRLAYWAAASWAAQIALSKNSPDVVADLPRAVALARLVHRSAMGLPAEGANRDLRVDAATLLGTLEAARPGGSRSAAEALFDEALRTAGPDAAAAVGVRVAMAESLALPAGDRARFESLLQRALDTAPVAGAAPSLAHQVHQRRARWLLEAADDLF